MNIKYLLRYLSKIAVYQTEPVYNLNWIKPKKLFKEILGDSSITFVDVGARAGSAKELTPLESYINYIGFDADEEEVKRLASLPSKYLSTQYISSFVSKQSEKVKFNLHYEGGLSSIYDFGKLYTRWFKKNDVNPVEKVITLQADSLDNLVNQDVDIIKLDTQGNEYEILSGASMCLSKALMVEVEVEFVQMYESQKLAHDVMSQMYSRGYELLYLNRVFRSSVAFNGVSRGQMIFGDVLFGLSRDKALELSVEKQKKYCVLLINYGHTDFAFDIYNANPALQKHCSALGRFFDCINKKPFIFSRVLKFFVDKIVFVLLNARKTNGLNNDSDRSWPVR